jgi:hypothetical protein
MIITSEKNSERQHSRPKKIDCRKLSLLGGSEIIYDRNGAVYRGANKHQASCWPVIACSTFKGACSGATMASGATR